MSGFVRMLKDKMPVLVFSGLCAGTFYAVYYAHHQQITEKKVSCMHTMRQGVINDIKRDRIKQRKMQQQQEQQEHQQ